MAYKFATCLIDPGKHLFLRDKLPVHLELQVFDLLLALVEKQGRLVTKDDLVETVWPRMGMVESFTSHRKNR
jgi:DNA-binding winged helix-turn-helix (wHTH) protein